MFNRIHRFPSRKAQTILEYIFILVAVIVPIGTGIRTMLEDKSQKRKNLLYLMVKDSYGDKNLGVIGRPYP